MFPQMALFIAESAYDLFQACAPGGVCSFLSGIAVWTSTLWTRLSLTFLFPPLTKVLIAFHGGKTGDPELFLVRGCRRSVSKSRSCASGTAGSQVGLRRA